MVFNTTFNNIPATSWWSVLLVEEPGENHRPVQVIDKLYHIMLYRVHLLTNFRIKGMVDKTDHHDVAGILLKVVLNTISLTSNDDHFNNEVVRY
jgi:hypothetical protein